jgi:hypothetical protein
MTNEETAARVLLGALDDPSADLEHLLQDLRTIGWNDRTVGEAVRIDLAAQVFHGRGLADALRGLDDDSYRTLVTALVCLRPSASGMYVASAAA